MIPSLPAGREGEIMIKHLTTHGNSLALIIEKAVLDLLKISSKTPLEVSTDGKSIIISPVHHQRREKAFRVALSKINQRHAKTLKALAK